MTCGRMLLTRYSQAWLLSLITRSMLCNVAL